VAGHLLIGVPETRDYFGQVNCVRNYSAVTAACMMVRKDVFNKLGGFDEAFSSAYGDVDFCLRVRQAGYRIVWTPYAELLHNEAAPDYTRDSIDVSLMKERWGDLLNCDPYYNPNLTLEQPTYGLRV
jgi:GT2 family glycosyltransferase